MRHEKYVPSKSVVLSRFLVVDQLLYFCVSSTIWTRCTPLYSVVDSYVGFSHVFDGFLQQPYFPLNRHRSKSLHLILHQVFNGPIGLEIEPTTEKFTHLLRVRTLSSCRVLE